MPYEVRKGCCGCSPEEYAVVKVGNPDAKALGCHATADEAGAQIGAIEHSEEMSTVTDAPVEGQLPDGWRGPIAALDMVTGDDRWLATPETGVRMRETPMSFTYLHVNEPGFQIIGTLDRAWADGDRLWGEGSFDLKSPEGSEYARKVADGLINMVSIDPDQLTAEYAIALANGSLDYDVNKYVDMDFGTLNLPEGAKPVMVFKDWRLSGVALVPISAYSEARIEPIYGYQRSAPKAGDAIVSSAGDTVAPLRAAWFAKQDLKGPTDLTITEEGQIFGHAATWEACHLDFPGMCLTAPMAIDEYERFHVHRARLDDGSLVRCGVLTYGDGHVSQGGLRASARHYSNVASVAGKMIAYEDEFGIQVAGQIVGQIDPEELEIIRHAPLSGHWEPNPDLGGELSMIAVHAVVVPGFMPPAIVAAFDPETERQNLIITTPRRTIERAPGVFAADAWVDVDKLAAAVEQRLHERAAEKARKMELLANLQPRLDARRAERIAGVKTRLGLVD